MRKYTILTLGRARSGWLQYASNHFTSLLARYAHVDWEIPADPKGLASLSNDARRSAESQALMSRLRERDFVVALDETGNRYTTTELATNLNRWEQQATGRFVWTIGGAYGLDDTFRTRANVIVSLSPMTLSHQLARIVLLEQLYRVLDLQAGGSYHHS